jgi:hypothetical protein
MASGGARWGAGRPDHRLKAEDTTALDVNYLARNGYLIDGNWKRVYWSRFGEVRLTALVKAFDRYITLDIGANTHWLHLTQTRCHLGGHRRWFVCPTCQNRMGVLYLRNRHFGCRRCQKISYQSQSGDAEDRMVWRYHTLSDRVFNWKFRKAARFDRTYNKFLDVAEQFEDLVERGLRRIAVADSRH